jgi:hypothetical protein
MSSRRESWEPVYEKHPKLSAFSRITNARESARSSWRGRAPFPQSRMPASIEEFNKAKCMKFRPARSRGARRASGCSLPARNPTDRTHIMGPVLVSESGLCDFPGVVIGSNLTTRTTPGPRVEGGALAVWPR